MVVEELKKSADKAIEKRKVNLRIECDACYGLVEAEYKSGVYTCRCGREIDLEIIECKEA